MVPDKRHYRLGREPAGSALAFGECGVPSTDMLSKHEYTYWFIPPPSLALNCKRVLTCAMYSRGYANFSCRNLRITAKVSYLEV